MNTTETTHPAPAISAVGATWDSITFSEAVRCFGEPVLGPVRVPVASEVVTIAGVETTYRDWAASVPVGTSTDAVGSRQALSQTQPQYLVIREIPCVLEREQDAVAIQMPTGEVHHILLAREGTAALPDLSDLLPGTSHTPKLVVSDPVQRHPVRDWPYPLIQGMLFYDTCEWCGGTSPKSVMVMTSRTWNTDVRLHVPELFATCEVCGDHEADPVELLDIEIGKLPLPPSDWSRPRAQREGTHRVDDLDINTAKATLTRIHQAEQDAEDVEDVEDVEVASCLADMRNAVYERAIAARDALSVAKKDDTDVSIHRVSPPESLDSRRLRAHLARRRLEVDRRLLLERMEHPHLLTPGLDPTIGQLECRLAELDRKLGRLDRESASLPGPIGLVGLLTGDVDLGLDRFKDRLEEAAKAAKALHPLLVEQNKMACKWAASHSKEIRDAWRKVGVKIAPGFHQGLTNGTTGQVRLQYRESGKIHCLVSGPKIIARKAGAIIHVSPSRKGRPTGLPFLERGGYLHRMPASEVEAFKRRFLRRRAFVGKSYVPTVGSPCVYPTYTPRPPGEHLYVCFQLADGQTAVLCSAALPGRGQSAPDRVDPQDLEDTVWRLCLASYRVVPVPSLIDDDDTGETRIDGRITSSQSLHLDPDVIVRIAYASAWVVEANRVDPQLFGDHARSEQISVKVQNHGEIEGKSMQSATTVDPLSLRERRVLWAACETGEYRVHDSLPPVDHQAVRDLQAALDEAWAA